jgi:hypothetical protein
MEEEYIASAIENMLKCNDFVLQSVMTIIPSQTFANLNIFPKK